MNLLNTVTMLAGFGDWAQKVGSDLLDIIVDLTIGPLLWGLCDIFFIILNLFESMFRAVAGVGQVGAEGGEDIVLYLIQSRVVLEVFVSVLVLSLFLLVIFTIFAIVKNIYAEKQEPVSKIISASFKGLLMYLLVPVATIVCLMVGNIVLQAIDGATRPSTDTSASDMLFITATYNANKLRDNDLGVAQMNLQALMTNGSITNIEDEMASIGITDIDSAGMAERWQLDMIADWIDEGFVSDEGLVKHSWVTGNKWNYHNVSAYYHTMQISYLIVWVGGAFLIWAIGKITWGLVARMFKMTLYFAISPAVMATFPLDNGKALGAWRSEMVKNGTMAFVAVGLLNILYTILPFINSSSIFDGFASGIAGLILSLFINIIAFSSIKDLIASISGWFGTGDALAEGVKAKGTVTKPLKKAALTGVGAFVGFKMGMDAAGKQDKNKMLGGFTGALGGALGSDHPFAAWQADVDKRKKSGESFYKRSQTHNNFGFGAEDKDKTAEWEAREIIDKENKGINEKITRATWKREQDVQELQGKLDRREITASEFSEEYAEIYEKYNKVVEKLKSSANYLDALFEDAQKDLEDKKKKNDKRQSNFASMDSLERTYEQDNAYRKKILSASGFSEGSLAYKTLESQWGDIKQGKFSVIRDDATRKKIESAYATYASDILGNDHEQQRAKQSMANLANSGKDGLKYVQKVLGDQFTRMFDEVRNAAGKIESYSLKADTTLSDANISNKIKKEQEGINKALKEWEKANEDLITERAAKYGTSVQEDLRKIGKNAGKK